MTGRSGEAWANISEGQTLSGHLANPKAPADAWAEPERAFPVRLLGPSHSFQKGGVIPDIIRGIVMVRGEDHQNGIRGVLVFGGPHQRWDVNSKGGSVEAVFLPPIAIVNHHRTSAPDAKHELVAFLVGMLSPHVGSGDLKGHEKPAGPERQRFFELTNREIASGINDHGQLVGPDPPHR